MTRTCHSCDSEQRKATRNRRVPRANRPAGQNGGKGGQEGGHMGRETSLSEDGEGLQELSRRGGGRWQGGGKGEGVAPTIRALAQASDLPSLGNAPRRPAAPCHRRLEQCQCH
eukprot:1482794-Rhodomonas_salina.2